MLVDRTELAFQTLADKFWQRIAVDLLGALPADAVELFLRALDERREHSRRDRAHLVYHIGDFICVRHHDLIRLFFAQIGKFLEHLGCGAHIKRGLNVRVREALARHQDFTVVRVLGIEEMHVAGGDNWDPQLIGQLSR